MKIWRDRRFSFQRWWKKTEPKPEEIETPGIWYGNWPSLWRHYLDEIRRSRGETG